MSLILLLESVELIWFIWLSALVGFVCLHVRLLGYRPVGRLRNLHADQTGAVYVLSVAMVLPFYVMLIAVIIETSLLLVTKLGTSYAAYYAVRSAVVWDFEPPHAGPPAVSPPDQPKGAAKARATQSAQLAMVPFSSGLSLHQSTTGGVAANHPYVRGIHAAAPDLITRNSYLQHKVAYATAATSVALSRVRQGEAESLRATVRHEYPFRVAIVGRLFGGHSAPWNQAVLVRSIHSSYELPSEAPQNAERSLGINYPGN